MKYLLVVLVSLTSSSKQEQYLEHVRKQEEYYWQQFYARYQIDIFEGVTVEELNQGE